MSAGPVTSLAPESRASRESDATYRPHLDGLRALAVYLVVLFHAGISSFSGGYIGVDVFFVLSGFLVTQLLLRDIAGGGAIRFGRFYSRRFRRLLPAAFVTLIVTGFVFTAIAPPSEVGAVVGSFKAAFLYCANLYFIRHSQDYFGAGITNNPVLQFWSLAVEEQFYLVWPLALGGAYFVTRRLSAPLQLRLIRIAVIGGALASVAWALAFRHTNLSRSYYGTESRAYELLAGAFLALTPAIAVTAKRFGRWLQLATLLSTVAIVSLAMSWVHLDPIERGIAVTAATCVLLVAIEVAAGGPVKRLLSTRPVVFLGQISYGTYLWHWIVIIVAVRTFELSPITTLGVTCLVATALAALSFELLERPVRTSALLDRHRRIVIASGLAITVVSALVFIPRIVDPANATKRSPANASGVILTPLPAGLDFNVPAFPFQNCLDKPASACTLVKGPGRHVLLMGDSHAAMMVPAFTELAKREGLTLSVSLMGLCPWQRGLTVAKVADRCRRLRADDYTRLLNELHPDVVAVMDIGYGTPGPYPTLVDDRGKPATAAEMAALTKSSVDALRANGRDVLLLEPVPLPMKPNPAFNPFTCLEQATTVEQCRYISTPSPSPLDRTYRATAAAFRSDRIRSLDLDTTVCPTLPICDPVVDGRIVKFDESHLTTKFSQSLAPELASYLARAGFLPRAKS
jgi:peptidoglycan/LPS O-acetylase OafA/YrhL